MKRKILVIDDEPGIRSFFKEFLAQKGYEVFVAGNWDAAEKIFYSNALDVILVDVQLPGKNGIEILKEVKSRFPMLEIIVFSARAKIELAVEAIKEGAFDFIEKTDAIEKILTIIENALKIKKLKEENLYLKKISHKVIKTLIGESEAIRKIQEEIAIAAQTDANVLITGENGTGKQIVAENIHYLSEKLSGNFVDINCAAIPENLLESELFGYEKGAFTGAVANTKGKFEMANGGTMFLDEIGELPMVLQAKLLKALESRIFSPLGSTKSVQLSARIIAATNRDIESEITENKFRKDLYYRLNVIHIHLPSLRERAGDIPLLLNNFLKEIGKESKKFAPSAIDLLMQYNWPGNVRELRNIVERAVIMTGNQKIIEQSDLERYIQVGKTKPKEEVLVPLKDYLNLKEKEYLEKVLNHFGTQKEASELLQIERTVLYRKIKKYHLKD